ncbi:MAG: LytR/AlgR family response regulator transcription factor [Rhodanobacteraceae bacterium]
MDDVPLARRHVRRYLGSVAGFEVVGECGDGEKAIDAIGLLHPDLVFLDVQMPELNGFEVLERIPNEELPFVIFVTAYDKYAIRAFEVHALDYLLKPFDKQRFFAALQRTQEQIDLKKRGQCDDRLLGLLDDLRAAAQYRARLAVVSSGKTLLVQVDNIDWIEAAGNYASLHVGKDIYSLRETISGLGRQLDPKRFARIHRSFIVNIDRIKDITPLFNRDRCVRLRDGTELTMSRSYSDQLERLLG